MFKSIQALPEQACGVVTVNTWVATIRINTSLAIHLSVYLQVLKFATHYYMTANKIAALNTVMITPAMYI